MKTAIPANVIIVNMQDEDALEFEKSAWQAESFDKVIRQFPIDGDFVVHKLHSFCLDFHEDTVFCDARFVPA